jgi:predicted unusual protein kinase regulating ubiquinone biosynthesis (AarF/ABC1/UbiB family)
MTDQGSTPRPLAVPSGRLARVGRLGTMTAGIASGAALQGVRRYASGERPEWRDLLLTPANIRRVADELARMRGAAMKVGQLISMDTGDVLPPELSQIMARLRASADFMPPRQLRIVLTTEWGGAWQAHFRRFDVRPIAAASIGQVHRATLKDGAELAIKVQYPGIRRSIDSDVENVAALARVAGLVPKGLDLAPLLAEAKAQLHEEADYAREGAALARFGALLADAPDFAVPRLVPDLTTRSILAMGYQPGQPVEAMQDAPQAERDRVIRLLLELLFRELFEFGAMQTDPNFANFRYDPATRRIVLLDFGATREVPPGIAAGYRALFRAGLSGTAAELDSAALGLGLIAGDTRPRHRAMVTGMIALVFSGMRPGTPYDFADAALAEDLRARGMEMAAERDFVHVPPLDVLFVQRKFGGLFLLARTLRARVDVGALLAPWL